MSAASSADIRIAFLPNHLFLTAAHLSTGIFTASLNDLPYILQTVYVLNVYFFIWGILGMFQQPFCLLIPGAEALMLWSPLPNEDLCAEPPMSALGRSCLRGCKAQTRLCPLLVYLVTDVEI